MKPRQSLMSKSLILYSHCLKNFLMNGNRRARIPLAEVELVQVSFEMNSSQSSSISVFEHPMEIHRWRFQEARNEYHTVGDKLDEAEKMVCMQSSLHVVL